MKEKLTKEEVQKLAKLAIEKLAPNNNGIRAVNSGIVRGIEVIQEVFELGKYAL